MTVSNTYDIKFDLDTYAEREFFLAFSRKGREREKGVAENDVGGDNAKENQERRSYATLEPEPSNLE